VYFRFAYQRPLLVDLPNVERVELKPEKGFESFITQIHQKIKDEGKGRNYVFDSMSDLVFGWFSDRMVGNFFKLTCPFLYEMETVAYFSILRYYHSSHATVPITETTQLLLDVYRYKNKLYLQPQKVWGRFTPTLFMLHEWDNDRFVPVKESGRISDVLSSSRWSGLRSASYRQVGVWDKQFMAGEEILNLLNRNEIPKERAEAVFERLVLLAISRDERIQELVKEYFSLADLIYIWKRMIGSGMIGGKSVGMLLARAILKKHNPEWVDRLEAHDSFFIGSDVFYTFLVENGCWWMRQQQKDPKSFLQGIDETRDKIFKGRFPDYIVTRFSDMLEYFGQSPIIVRSSSLLEDNFGNAFAGKYDSVFCANQGTHVERLAVFMNAVRFVYASTMSREALAYRAKRGVLDKDEQMALLVQRVSGAPYGRYFFPQVAGVAFSFNSYAWNRKIDPEAGVMRIVFGLGTRAVERADDDYTRVVALNAPELRPEATLDQVRRYAQRRVDLLDIENNCFKNAEFVDITRACDDMPLDLFAIRDRAVEKMYRERGTSGTESWIIAFDSLFSRTDFIKNIREMLATLRAAYGSHVDLEFTANFQKDGPYKINLLQCRPLQVTAYGGAMAPLPSIGKKRVVLRANGGVIGHSRLVRLDWLVYVAPQVYGHLPERSRHEAAKLIGRICHHDRLSTDQQIMLIGPGRWGTSTPSLGIPVSFGEINTTSVLCEIDFMHEGLAPDLSLGTHFFNEMVEMNILYLAYFTGMKENVLNVDFLMGQPNRLTSLFPEETLWSDAIRVIETAEIKNGSRLFLNADSVEQRGIVYLDQ
jgi:pyruvate,water dikinase